MINSKKLSKNPSPERRGEFLDSLSVMNDSGWVKIIRLLLSRPSP
jgi:hypothetical protein